MRVQEGVVEQRRAICSQVDQLDARGVVTPKQVQQDLLPIGEDAGDSHTRGRDGAADIEKARLLNEITDTGHGMAWGELHSICV